MKICEIVYERDINGKIIKKTKIYGEELMEQEVPPKEVESVLEILKYDHKKALTDAQKCANIQSKGRQYE